MPINSQKQVAILRKNVVVHRNWYYKHTMKMSFKVCYFFLELHKKQN